jgi:hypothetical protein
MNCFKRFISWEQNSDCCLLLATIAPVFLLLICWYSGQICGDPLSFPFLLPFSHCSSCVWGLFELCRALYTIGRHSTKKEGSTKGRGHREGVIGKDKGKDKGKGS